MTRIETEVTQLCRDEGIELLEFGLSGKNGSQMIRAIVDRRVEGITISDCEKITRQIKYLVEEKQLVSGNYRLEVTSPGLDYPLRLDWQFIKNIGRLLKIRIPGEKGPKEISGRLTAVEENFITLVAGQSELKLKFEELLSAKVLPEFK